MRFEFGHTVVIVCVSLSYPGICSMLLHILSVAHLTIITEDIYRPIANLKKKKKVNFSVKHNQHFISLSREEQLTIPQFWWQMVIDPLFLEQSHTDHFVCLRNTLMKKINTMPLMVPSPYTIGE